MLFRSGVQGVFGHRPQTLHLSLGGAVGSRGLHLVILVGPSNLGYSLILIQLFEIVNLKKQTNKHTNNQTAKNIQAIARRGNPPDSTDQPPQPARGAAAPSPPLLAGGSAAEHAQ